MKFRYSLLMALLVPFLSFSEGVTNGVSNAVAETNLTAEVVETNAVEPAAAETNAQPVEEEAEAEPVVEREPVSVPDLTFFVKDDETGGSGSAFLFEDEEGVWLVSNVHVFSGSTNLTLKNINREELFVPAQIEVAKDRDILRFRVDQPCGLTLSADCDFEEELIAYGDSGGAGVLTRLEGKVVAPGPDRVEVSCGFIPGNSGGPVVNADDEVVGVSSYLFRDNLPDWIADGTRFSDTRRMAIRLNDVEWVPAEFSDFYEQTLALQKLDELLSSVIFITVALSEDMTYTLRIGAESQGLQNWVKKHNKYAERGSLNNIASNLGRLAAMMQRLEEAPTGSCEITIPFLQEQLKDTKEACEATRKQLEMLSE